MRFESIEAYDRAKGADEFPDTVLGTDKPRPCGSVKPHCVFLVTGEAVGSGGVPCRGARWPGGPDAIRHGVSTELDEG
ncbi:MAG TPA: hypothetical protein VL485_18620 [Ktedonobacteraceae bacterium]|jgi:hypothetical protein|nr:hypothetical protein [Ktedonobacteraceae bacterium]